MNLQKRNCPISFRFVPYGSGWEDVYLTVNGEDHYFVVTAIWGDRVDALSQVLLHFHSRYQHHYDPAPQVASEDSREEFNGPCFKAEFCWDAEGSSSTWSLVRSPGEDDCATIEITITEKEESEAPETPFHFSVGFKDLCYAVAKGVTEAMKRHGLHGYFEAVWSHDINLRKLLFLKAFALDATDVLKVEDLGRGNGERTDFAKELELILFDM